MWTMPGAVLGADEVAGDDVGSSPRSTGMKRVERLVVQAQQVAALDPAQHLAAGVARRSTAASQRLRQPQLIVAVLAPARSRCPRPPPAPRCRAASRASSSRPGSTCPGWSRSGNLTKTLGSLRAFLVAQRQLVAAQRRAAARAVGHDLVALVDQARVPELLQDPPQRLDVVVGEGDVGRRQVHPVADALGQLLPLLDVLEDALAALLVERGDAVLLDRFLAGEAQLASRPRARPAGRACPSRPCAST